jgi:hypothetical protein
MKFLYGKVSVIGDWNLRFICNLVLVICDLIGFHLAVRE